MCFICCYCCLLCFLPFACGKEYCYEGGLPADQSSKDLVIYKSVWEFNESTKHYQTPVDTAFLTKETGRRLLTISVKAIAQYIIKPNQFFKIKKS